MHLLKWHFQPMRRSRSWRGTIRNQRRHIERVLKESPSLRCEVAALSRQEHAVARGAASSESGFALRTFPKWLPYSSEQILDEDCFPGPIDETS
jgi:hypothetical protein